MAEQQEEFTARFNLLYRAAGCPPVEQLCQAGEALDGQRLDPQLLTAWLAGEIPGEFHGPLETVLRVLIARAEARTVGADTAREPQR